MPAGRRTMALTDAQQELLHAFVDCETTPAETQIAQQLLARDAAARLYVEELKRLRRLLRTHGCVNAPAGLHQRVCAALENDFSGPPVLALPRVAWRSALYAAAAAVVVSLALVIGPQLDQRDEPPTQGIARTPEFSAAMIEPPAATDTVPLQPAPPALEPDEQDGINEAGKPATVLRLDRGIDQPFELSLDLNRVRDASALQVYNDILVVSSLYGPARLQDSNRELEEFTGRDFSVYDGVEVELESAQVPKLLAALDRMNADQSYGRIIVPADLRHSINETTRDVDELQQLSRDSENGPKGEQSATKDSARAYLPPEVQRDCLPRNLAELPEKVRAKANALTATDSKTEQGTSRKLRLVIRLR